MIDEPQSIQSYTSDVTSSIKEYSFHTNTQNWDINIANVRRNGERVSMEDISWFIPPFKHQSNTYIQAVIIDGHSTFPIELESLKRNTIQILSHPLNTNIIQTWAYDADTSWSHHGGCVFHFISLCWNHTIKSSKIYIHRWQVGDCNSCVMINYKSVLFDWMPVHNTTNKNEVQRLKPYIQNGRIRGVLECSRTIGDHHVKSTIPEGNIHMGPTCDHDSGLSISNPFLFITIGSDGALKPIPEFSISSIQSTACRMATLGNDLNKIGSYWISNCQTSDKCSLILISLRCIS